MHTEVWVQEADFSVQAVCDGMRSRHRDVGAVVSFVGVVRDVVVDGDRSLGGHAGCFGESGFAETPGPYNGSSVK